MAGLIAAGLVIPALLTLYFLKLRRREMVVSSTLLWRKAVRDLQVNAPFQKLRRNLLLLLQLILLLALLLALARPTLRGLASSGEQLVLVIDQSASMNATDVAPSRLERAKAWALRKVEEFEGGGGVMVVTVAQQARVVQPFTTDRSLLRHAISGIEPTDQVGRLGPALQLIEPYAIGGEGEGAKGSGLEVTVLSDGRFADEGNLSLRNAKLQLVRMAGESADERAGNLAITAMSARRDYQRPQRVQVYARLSNDGDVPIQAKVSLMVDGRVRQVSAVEVPPVSSSSASGGVTGTAAATGGANASSNNIGQPGQQSLSFELTLTSGALIGLSHDHVDALSIDNAAWLTLAPPRPLRVLLVTEGNAFLERAIEAVGVRRLVTMTPKKYEDQSPEQLRRGEGDEGFDLIVFDEYSPTTQPTVNSVSLGGTGGIAGMERKATREGEPKTQMLLNWRREHPLLRYVVLDDLLLVEPGRLAVPQEAVVLATGQAGPVMAEMVTGGTRHVVTSFNVLKTNWPMQVSFAVFMSNCLEVLGLEGSGSVGRWHQPGEVVTLPTVAGAGVGATVVYEGPVRLEGRGEDGQAVLPMLERVGLYQATTSVPSSWERLAVNLLDEGESDLRSAEQLQVGTTSVQALAQDVTVRREIWPWLAWAALAMLMIEWVVYTRRMHL